MSIRQTTKDLADRRKCFPIWVQLMIVRPRNKAIESYNQAVSLWKMLNNDTEATKNLYHIGFTYYNSLNEPEKALDPLKQSLELMQTRWRLWG